MKDELFTVCVGGRGREKEVIMLLIAKYDVFTCYVLWAKRCKIIIVRIWCGNVEFVCWGCVCNYVFACIQNLFRGIKIILFLLI